ncbi:hypothetical protein [Roseiterribacter gracilis]|uniref:Membrane protein n=1 Tax=Roseiterribacter gracilis TaxID=2812848 RepID=A0A8S8XGK5_9PROT|nr:membrane protein [Rhodospirillales bacterium TMPK1]
MDVARIAFDPLVSWWLIAPLTAIGLAVVLFGALRGAAGAFLRALGVTLFALALSGPSLVEEKREPVKDVAVVVLDASPSQRMGDRLPQARSALDTLRQKLATFADLETRVVTVGDDGKPMDETRLFGALETAYGDVPRDRRAGAILLTDGQVHDVPAKPDGLGPVHGLISGKQDERDRRLAVQRAPTYGIVGKTAQTTLKVEDSAGIGATRATVRITRDGTDSATFDLPIGIDRNVNLPIVHGGPNVFEIEVEAAPGGEITLANNRAAIVVTGVRERLRVLLISGEPHNGERTWRNLLKSDPSVDLVHFTILRPPDKQDGTPIRELSLIAFPIKELFEVKLNEFDLVIFDRYEQRGILPPAYYENLAQYVERGGAILEASGPGFSTPLSLYRTALRSVLPGAPTRSGPVMGAFRPSITELGRRHPVTAALPGAGDVGETPSWGSWLRQVDISPQRGQVVMQGAQQRPLLLLDRVGDGRVAQLASDQIWLWSRGYEGGGPQAELLRRLAHWLMKEPELEEDELRAKVDGARVTVERQSLQRVDSPVHVTEPGGHIFDVPLTTTPGDGVARGSFVANEPGVHRLTQDDKVAFAVVGRLNPPELMDARSTDTKLAPVAATTGGAVRWLEEGVPDVRRVDADRPAAGGGWIGLVRNGRYQVTGTRELPLLPPSLALALFAVALAGAWWREGRR